MVLTHRLVSAHACLALLTLVAACGDVGASGVSGSVDAAPGDAGRRPGDASTSTIKLPDGGAKGKPGKDGSAGFADGSSKGADGSSSGGAVDGSSFGGSDGSSSGGGDGSTQGGDGGSGPAPGSDASRGADGRAGGGGMDAGESLDAMLVIPDSGWPVRPGDAGSAHHDAGSTSHGDAGSTSHGDASAAEGDAGSKGQGDSAAAAPPTYCSRYPGALWCLDFDESTDLSSIGPYTTFGNGGSLAIVPSVPDSPPNSLLASLARTDASAEAVAMLTRTFPLPAGSGLTVQVDVNVPAVWNAASFPSVLQVYSGAVIMTASLNYDANGPVYVSWTPYEDYEPFRPVYIPAGTYHTITATIENGNLYALVDGVLAGTVPESGLGPEVTVQLGLFSNEAGRYTVNAAINLDNLVIVAR